MGPKGGAPVWSEQGWSRLARSFLGSSTSLHPAGALPPAEQHRELGSARRAEKGRPGTDRGSKDDRMGLLSPHAPFYSLLPPHKHLTPGKSQTGKKKSKSLL